MVMREELNKNNVNNAQKFRINISKEQTDILARRLLPEIKKFYVNKDIRREFEEWKKKQQAKKHK